MARTEEQKAARRARRAIAREKQEEAIKEHQRLLRERYGPDPLEDVICYKCQRRGHYAAVCGAKREKKEKGKEKESKRFRSEIICFKCHKKGHFISHCPSIEKTNRAPTATVDGPTLCFHCKQMGHQARDCSKRQRGRQAVLRPARAKGLRMLMEDGSMLHHCGNCKNWGHVEVECTNPYAEEAERVNTKESFLRRCGIEKKSVGI